MRADKAMFVQEAPFVFQLVCSSPTNCPSTTHFGAIDSDFDELRLAINRGARRTLPCVKCAGFRL